MEEILRSELFTRSTLNPVITPGDVGHHVAAVFNPGAAEFEGRTLLLARCEMRTGRSELIVMTSINGVSGWEIEWGRGLEPLRAPGHEEMWGVEDARITRIGDEYHVVYVGHSDAGPLVELATTHDFVTWTRRGVLWGPDNRDAALFNERIDGQWAMLHRPTETGVATVK